MNKLLLLVVACVLSVSTVGATATVSAAQIGHSPIYSFDVTYNGKAVGYVVVNTATNPPTYTLVAYGLTPTTNYTFGYNASGVPNVLGTMSTTAAGVLSVHWTFPAADVKDLQSAQFWVMNSPPGGRVYRALYGFCLQNFGWFVAKFSCEYSTDGGVTWQESDHTSGITRGHEQWVPLYTLGVPANALVKFHAIVVGGKDKTDQDSYNYNYTTGARDQGYAAYYITGTTLNNNLVYEGMYTISS